MISETVALLSIHNAKLREVKDIMYIGNTVAASRRLQEELRQVTEAFGFRYHGLEKGEYSGAVGALLS